ncbi:GbsR/MarR family transcriptional regulator [Nonomuraea zeae]|uniref:MarR family transcriptional regulator n=1 Tax=Nonomuraea zeae TaxID=1642303 RepID=A0A5S4GAA9_9ACTN|nr:MarR family transcriptional regulator [Nonomuraea zeae]TMR29802.1 MarR family transcriptional regulator [Nonomuraea zeae]
MNLPEIEFVDRMGLIMERLGGTRTMGRLYAWLMVCDPPDQSLTELATELGVSKTAVSTVARQLELSGMAERVPSSTREHRYRVVAGGWAQIMRVQFAILKQSLDTLDFGLSILGDDRPGQRSRLEDTREFFAFILQDSDEMFERWKEYREKTS